jgi:Bardet-Biedl syndrome 1 protein
LEPEDIGSFASVFKQLPLRKQSVVTCMTVMYKSYNDENSSSCLVIGSENRDVYILDPAAFTFLSRVELPAVPVFLSVDGLYDVDYSINAACRDGCVYTVKKDFPQGMPSFPCISLSSQAVGLINDNKNVIVGTMNQILACYTTGGKLLWSVTLPHNITAMERVDYKMRNFKAVIVALANGDVRIYKEKYLINSFRMDDPVVGMKFGQFGREDGSLILIGQTGSLTVKILKRTAILEVKESRTGPLQSQISKLNIPKKTKIFVDQTVRERENAIFMHQTFQHQLLQLKLDTAKSYIQAVSSSLAPVTTSNDANITLSAQVQGIGPVFKMTVILHNTSLSKSLIDHYLVLKCDESLYTITNKYIKLPLIVPGLSYLFSTLVECLNDLGRTDSIEVHVHRHGNPIPLLKASIDMPASENIVM